MSEEIVNIACEYLGVSPASVVKSRETEDSVILLVDLGIKGTPKYTVPKNDLPKPEPKPQTRKKTTRKGGRSAKSS